MHLVTSVCLSVCNAVTFEILDLQSSFLLCRYILRIIRSSSCIKVKVKATGTIKNCLCFASLCNLKQVVAKLCKQCAVHNSSVRWWWQT